MRTVGQRARPAALWSFVEVVVRQLLLLATTILLARLLAPADFGLVAMVLVFTVIGTTLVDAGFGSALIQRAAVDKNHETTAFQVSLACGLASGGLLCLAAPAVAHLYQVPALSDLVRLMALVLPLTALGIVPDALLTRRLAFRDRAKAEALASVSAGAIAIGLALHGYGAWSLAWQTVAAAGFRSVLLWRFARWKPGGAFSPDALHGLWGFGGYVLGANLLDAIYTRLQALLLGRVAGPGELGQYNLAQNVQQAPATLVATVLNRVGLASFSPLAADGARLREALQRTLIASMFAFAPAMLGVSLLSGLLVPPIFGPDWRPAAQLLAVLALAAIPWPWHVLNLVALNAMGHSRLVLRVEIAKKTVTILLVLMAAPFGALALAWAVVAGSYLSLILNAHYASRLLDYGLLRQLRDLLPTLLACALSAGLGSAAYALTTSGPGALILACLVYSATYLMVSIASGQPGPRECLEIARAWREAVGLRGPDENGGEH